MRHTEVWTLAVKPEPADREEVLSSNYALIATTVCRSPGHCFYISVNIRIIAPSMKRNVVISLLDSGIKLSVIFLLLIFLKQFPKRTIF